MLAEGCWRLGELCFLCWWGAVAGARRFGLASAGGYHGRHGGNIHRTDKKGVVYRAGAREANRIELRAWRENAILSPGAVRKESGVAKKLNPELPTIPVAWPVRDRDQRRHLDNTLTRAEHAHDASMR